MAEEIAAAFEQLKVAAAHLNKLSAALGKWITELEQILQRLHLGVQAWVEVDKDVDSYGNFTEHLVGYTKLGSKWGIALSVTEGNYAHPDQWNAQEWPFNESPRRYRIKAVDKLPELLDRLVKESYDTAEKIKGKIAVAEAVVAAIKGESTGTATAGKDVPDHELSEVLQAVKRENAARSKTSPKDASMIKPATPGVSTAQQQAEALRESGLAKAARRVDEKHFIEAFKAVAEQEAAAKKR